jgi:hypothetical protein
MFKELRMPFYKSRKIMLLLVDTLFSVLGYFVGRYAGVSTQDLLFLIGALQPVVVALIVSWTVDDTVQVWVRLRSR